MTNIIKGYTIQGFELENSPDTKSCVVITKDTSKDSPYTIKIPMVRNIFLFLLLTLLSQKSLRPSLT